MPGGVEITEEVLHEESQHVTTEIPREEPQDDHEFYNLKEFADPYNIDNENYNKFETPPYIFKERYSVSDLTKKRNALLQELYQQPPDVANTNLQPNVALNSVTNLQPSNITVNINGVAIVINDSSIKIEISISQQGTPEVHVGRKAVCRMVS